MNKLLSFLSISLVFVWAIGYFWYPEWRSIRLLIFPAIITALIRIMRIGTIVIK